MGSTARAFAASTVAVEHERKYVVDRALAETFLTAVADRLELLIFDPSRPVAWTRTTYLDTPDLALLRGSRHVRLREYGGAPRTGGAPTFGGPAWLEVKEREGSIRRKQRFQAEQADVDVLLAGDGLEPQVTVLYQRTSFSAAEGDEVRVTVDQQITYRAPRAGTPFAEGPDVIVEVKHRGETPAWLAAATARLTETPAFSKFRHAMGARR
jgi:hypothetical protein